VLLHRAKLVGQLVLVLCMLGFSIVVLSWARDPGVQTTGTVVEVEDGECIIRYQDTRGNVHETYDNGSKWSDCDARIGDLYDVWFDPDDPDDGVLDGPTSNAILAAFYFAMAAGFATNLWWRLRRGAWDTAPPDTGAEALLTDQELEAQFPVHARAERIVDWLERHLSSADLKVLRSLVESGDGIGALEYVLRVLVETPARLSAHEARLLRDLIMPRDALSPGARADLKTLVGNSAD
jgi:hypothetical protein